jgi:hypothetical protein
VTTQSDIDVIQLLKDNAAAAASTAAATAATAASTAATASAAAASTAATIAANAAAAASTAAASAATMAQKQENMAKELLGNGQPGRIQRLEAELEKAFDKIDALNKRIWIFTGILLAVYEAGKFIVSSVLLK